MAVLFLERKTAAGIEDLLLYVVPDTDLWSDRPVSLSGSYS
jgi:hypothetical protein